MNAGANRGCRSARQWADWISHPFDKIYGPIFDVVTLAGEGMVLAICKVFPVKFANAKVGMDLTLVTTAAVLSLLFLGTLVGVREGTVAAAVSVGLIAKRIGKVLERWNLEKE